MRTSNDERKDGFVWNGFDYSLQVWVVNGVIQNCGHPENFLKGHGCCNARHLKDQVISQIQGASEALNV